MASTSAVEEHPDTEEHLFEEEIEEETVWDEHDAHNYLENNKKMVMAYDDSQCELATQEAGIGEEYQEVDVEEYDESAHAEPYRTNLPDLLSKKYPIGNEVITMCFSKRGSTQITFNGYLYNFSHTEGSNHTWVCINPECTAVIITDIEMTSYSKENNIHCDICEPDEAQLRLRISIYDLRLMAEYTEVNLHTLYASAAGAFAQENPDLDGLFPPFNALHRSLEDHRRNKLYRRCLTARGDENGDKRMGEEIDHDDESLLMSSIGEEVVEESYAERVPMEGELAINRQHQLYPYGRTRGFPPTFCVECGIDMPSHGRAFTPQHSLVQHVSRMHQPVKIHTFVFEPSAFEMWLREVQRCPALRFRRFSLIGEDMFYLCSCDMRLPRSKYSQPGCCTAYIKIADYRVVSQRAARLVSIEYAFEHFAHDIPMDGTKPPEKLIADLRPEDFLFQMERRKQATANLVRNRVEMNNRRYSLSNAISMQGSPRGYRVPENVFSASRSESRTAITRQVAISSKLPSQVLPISVRAAGARSLEPPGVITRRGNFKDQAIYDSVRQFEQLSHIVIRRLQNVKSVKIADHYSEIMRRMVNRIVTDMDCAPETSAQSIWCGLNAPRNGRNPALKRAAKEEGEGEEEDEGEEGEEETEGVKKKKMKKGEEETDETDKEAEELVKEKEEGEEQAKKDFAGGSEGEKMGVKTRGRSQLPVKSTLLAAGRVAEKEKAAVEEGEAVTPQSPKRKATTQSVKETPEKSLPPILARTKSSRIQARKEKIEGEVEEKKT